MDNYGYYMFCFSIFVLYASSNMRYINSFFNFIRSHFGCKICNLLKYDIKLFRLNVNLRLRIRFIRSCINLDLLPKQFNNMVLRKSRLKFLVPIHC